MSLDRHLKPGLNNTLFLNNGTGFSSGGPWVQAYDETVLDEWFVGSFSHAEYTIVVDYDYDNKEIIRCTVTAVPGAFDLTEFGRSTVGDTLVTITGSVDDASFRLLATPETGKDGCQIYLHRHYYRNNNLPEPRT